jgi:hypothetical protein
MQRRSAAEFAVRRAAIVAAVREVAPIEFVNGGGMYQPRLFDTYRAFSGLPAALFALPVVRRPGSGVVTVLGGGYLASGPVDASRLPWPHLPAGLKLDRNEGAGEVQTRCLARPLTACRSVTGSGSGTPRLASCASGSMSCT